MRDEGTADPEYAGDPKQQHRRRRTGETGAGTQEREGRREGGSLNSGEPFLAAGVMEEPDAGKQGEKRGEGDTAGRRAEGGSTRVEGCAQPARASVRACGVWKGAAGGRRPRLQVGLEGPPHKTRAPRRSWWSGRGGRRWGRPVPRPPARVRLSPRPAPLTCGSPAAAGWTPECPLPAS